LFIASYAIISNLFTSTTVFLRNCSSGNIKTNSIQPVSACLLLFEAIWHFLQAVWHFLFTWSWQPWPPDIDCYCKALTLVPQLMIFY